jgi:L-ascorbate metabolism protein UlaG (beta-lactamase superfamily)
MPEAKDYAANVDWLGHASFRLRGTATVYLDPWSIQGTPRDGDLVLITHSHYDHYSPEDIEKVLRPGGIVVMPRVDEEKATLEGVQFMEAGEERELAGVRIQAVPAYNVDKDFHPRSQRWLGYIVELDGVRIYHCGDCDVIEEMEEIKCHVALLPVSGTYVMNAREAVEATRRIGPQVAVPMHWGEIVGEREDAEYFAQNAPCEVVLKEEQP